MNNFFETGENTPELALYDLFTYVDDAEEAICWYKNHRYDGLNHEEAMKLAVEVVVPSTFLQTLPDRLQEQQSS